MNKTSIEWCDFTANPLKYMDAAGNVVWGCVHKSPGCVNCYAEQLAKRYGRGGPFNVSTMAGLEPFIDEKEIHRMLTYKPASGKRCFIGDMTDIFGEWVPNRLLDHLFPMMAERSDVTWQVLTKRADRMRQYVTDRIGYALPNVWLGVSAEDQERADARIPELLSTPAAVRFVSYEPALGPVDFNDTGIDWVIVGGESGPGSRPFNIEWARSVVRQCQAAGVPVFVKQLGAKPFRKVEVHRDYREVKPGLKLSVQSIYAEEGPVSLDSRKGSDPSEWPKDLRVREFPKAVTA